jgi:hypothetical protein
MAEAHDDRSPSRGISSNAEELPTPLRRSPRLLSQQVNNNRPAGARRRTNAPNDNAAPPAPRPSRANRGRPPAHPGGRGGTAVQGVVQGGSGRGTAVVGGRGAAVGGGRGAGVRSSTRAGSGPRFSIDELETMLTCIETVLPIGPEEWEMVADTHSLDFPAHNREASSLRRKFQSLYNQNVPTGDPSCPPHVRRAKRLRYKIEERADSSNMVGGGGDADLGFDDEEEQDEGEEVEEAGGMIEGEENNAAVGDQETGAAVPPTNNNMTPDDEATRQLNFDQEDLAGGSGSQQRRAGSSRRGRTPTSSVRPLVRTTSAVMMNRSRDNDGGAREKQVQELTAVVLANMATRMDREEVDREQRQRRERQEDADREERRANQQVAMQQQQQLTMAMVASLMAVVGAINPAAAAAVTQTAAPPPMPEQQVRTAEAEAEEDEDD